MKRILFLAILFPFAVSAQKTKPVKAKPPIKKAKVVKDVVPVKPADGFLIYGTVSNAPDGTPVSFLNGQTGMLDEQAKVMKGKFSFTGKLIEPELKQVYFGASYQPLQLFVDNSAIRIDGDAADINRATISGSPTHKLFGDLVNQITPLQQKLSFEGDVYDVETRNSLTSILKTFIETNPTSYVAPVALVILNNTAGDNEAMIEQLYNLLPGQLKISQPYGTHITQQIQAAKRNPLGAELTNFSQADSSGNQIALSSFRGKYLLIDFWASWCRPCRQENPNVVAAYNKYSNKNFTILGVSFDQAKPAWINAIAQDNLTWSHVSDLKGWGNAAAGLFGIQSIPQNLLLGPDGKVIGKNLRGKDLVRKLNAVLN